jgi:hypothetical protein
LTQTIPLALAAWISAPDTEAAGGSADRFARFADPDGITSGTDLFAFLGIGTVSPAAGVGAITSPAAFFDFLDFAAFSPAAAGVAVDEVDSLAAFDFLTFDVFSSAAAGVAVASVAAFFAFLGFAVFSVWVSVVCADAADCSIAKPHTQTVQAAIPWHRTVTLFRCIG